MRWIAIRFCIGLWMMTGLWGCASTLARQSMATFPTGTPTSTNALEFSDAERAAFRELLGELADGDATRSSQTAQQSGQANVTGQVNAGGWKGIEYTSAVPVGQVIVIVFVVWLSHRREMARIKRGSIHA